MSDYLEFKLWKAGIFLLMVAVWGFYCGVKGWDLTGKPSDKDRRD